MSDVEHAGWAVGGPGSRLRRRRNPLLGLLAFALIAGGVAAFAVGLVRLINEAGPSGDGILARGTVAALNGPPTPPAAFRTAGAVPVTVWLRAGGLSNVRESIVAGTACTLSRPDGSTAEFRGSRQGASVETDAHATIGTATTGAGANAVTCRHVRFGGIRNRNRLDEERPFIVELGTPADGLRGLWLLLPGLSAALLGIPVALRWRAGSLRQA